MRGKYGGELTAIHIWAVAMSDERADPAGTQGGGAGDPPTYDPNDVARALATAATARQRLQELGVDVPTAPVPPQLSDVPAPPESIAVRAASALVQEQIQRAIDEPGAPDQWFGKLVDELADAAVALGVSHEEFLEMVQERAGGATALEAIESSFIDAWSEVVEAEQTAMFLPSFPGQDGTAYASFAAMQRSSRAGLSVEPTQEGLAIKDQRQAEEDAFLWGDDDDDGGDDDGTGEGALPMTAIVYRHRHKFVETIRALLRPTAPHIDQFLDDPRVQPAAGGPIAPEGCRHSRLRVESTIETTTEQWLMDPPQGTSCCTWPLLL